MGCCASRQTGDSYPGGNAPTASSRNITSSSPPPRSTSQGSTSHPSALSPPLVNTQRRPNVPLKPIDPSHRSKIPTNLVSPTAQYARRTGLTRRQLEKERGDWWDTRTTGREEIWAALRLMVESLQLGQVGEAQALLDATECTCPNGMLWKGVFDGRGEWYRVQEWVVIEPEGLIDDDETDHGHEDDEDNISDKKEDAEVEEGSAENANKVKESKGKEVEVLGDEVKVLCRLSNTGVDYRIRIYKGEKVASLVAKLKSKASINPFALVRIVYGGQIIPETQPLESHPYWNYENRHVLIAMVFE
ncbi:unnamed protein product [Periconia digitata]|uniref:DC-UbP/UBTD2 N-terminal domain-containing protein n=1 Tax=Periconia digitata TaxID=1303443 RepID=A0A9W4U293_9PLEO|nr:unnamed protein product [Periconia digitata]